MQANDVKFIHILQSYKSTFLHEPLPAGPCEESEFSPSHKRIALTAIIDFLLLSLSNPKDEHKTGMKALALIIVKEEIKSGSTISDFMETLSLFKNHLFSFWDKFQIPDPMNKQFVIDINSMMDHLTSIAIPLFIERTYSDGNGREDAMSESHRERLTLLGQMTSSFVHEFRNPLTSIKGFIQLLKAEQPNLKYLDIISTELEQLNSRISQFLMISKREQSDHHPILFQLDTLIQDVIAFLYPSIVDTNVKVETEIEGEISLRGNAEEIRQVLLNIIFNALDALAHTSEPLISIKAKILDDGQAMIDIANNGPLIPEDIQKNLFQPFTTTKKLGTGLGLFVCKEIIENHKGTLSCSSSENSTHFFIHLPLTDDNSQI